MSNIITISHSGETPLECEIQLPLSKSVTARELMISAYSGSPLPVPGEGSCRDINTLYKSLVKIRESAEVTDTVEINVRDSGTALRFLLPYMCAMEGRKFVLTGTQRLRFRTIGPLVDGLRRLGADVEYMTMTGYAPLRINGKKLVGDKVFIDPTKSSQFVSALMLFGPTMPGGLAIHMTRSPVSQTYIEMTWRLMRNAGIEMRFPTKQRIFIPGEEYKQTPPLMERDWSAASFIYETVSFLPVGTRVYLPGLVSPAVSVQGDSAVPSLFRSLGVSPGATRNGLRAPTRMKFHKPNFFKANLNATPDLAPALATAMCGHGVSFMLDGLTQLKYKESNRLKTLWTLLGELGYETEYDDEMISGVHIAERKSNLTALNPRNDHRMAMAIAPLAIFSPITLKNPKVVDKSFPGFFTQLNKLGYTIS